MRRSMWRAIMALVVSSAAALSCWAIAGLELEVARIMGLAPQSLVLSRRRVCARIHGLRAMYLLCARARRKLRCQRGSVITCRW